MKTWTQKPSRALRWVAGSVGCLALASLCLGACFGAPGYRGPRSAHFDGERFINQIPQPSKGLTDYVSMRLDTEMATWPETLPNQPHAPPVQRVDQGKLRITVVGHSTVLLQIDGLNILTDPVWSDSIGPVSWAGKERARPPALTLDDLPPIDAILISHNHYDHLDIPTLQALHTRFHPVIFAGLGTRNLLAEHGIEGSVDLDWWQTRRLRTTSAHITAVPAQHWSGRGLGDQKNTLWMGFVLQSHDTQVYFAGDTGWGPHFEQIANKYKNLRLALLPIGAYKPVWFMRNNHISPQEAMKAHQILGARTSVPVHYGTFSLGVEGHQDPLQDLAQACAEQGVTRFRPLPFGMGWDVP